MNISGCFQPCNFDLIIVFIFYFYFYFLFLLFHLSLYLCIFCFFLIYLYFVLLQRPKSFQISYLLTKDNSNSWATALRPLIKIYPHTDSYLTMKFMSKLNTCAIGYIKKNWGKKWEKKLCSSQMKNEGFMLIEGKN